MTELDRHSAAIHIGQYADYQFSRTCKSLGISVDDALVAPLVSVALARALKLIDPNTGAIIKQDAA